MEGVGGAFSEIVGIDNGKPQSTFISPVLFNVVFMLILTICSRMLGLGMWFWNMVAKEATLEQEDIDVRVALGVSEHSCMMIMRR